MINDNPKLGTSKRMPVPREVVLARTSHRVSAAGGILHPRSELFMTMEEPLSPSLEIWIDGDCAVCRRSEQWCSARDPHRRLNFIDFHAPADDDPPGSQGAMAQMVHVRLRDGTVRTGFDAWREILFELDGWRWLTRVSGLPGIKHLGPVIYSILAQNRHRLPLNKA